MHVQNHNDRHITASIRNPWDLDFIRDHSKAGSNTYLFLNVLASHPTMPSVTTSSPKSMTQRLAQ